MEPGSLRTSEEGGRTMKKKASRALMVLTTTIMVVTVLAPFAYAASQTVYIHKGDGPVRSASITSNDGAHYSGSNYSTSGHSLWIDLQRSSGSGWVNEKTSLMAINSKANGESSLGGALLWRVQLNPQYWYTDCKGDGTVSNH
jgi:hypothetical protein